MISDDRLKLTPQPPTCRGRMQSPDSSPEPFKLPGLDLEFLYRVYRTSSTTLAISAILIWGRFGAREALGWAIGGVMTLAILVMVHYTVVRMTTGSQKRTAPVLVVTLGKMLFLTLLTGGAFWLWLNGHLSMRWLLAGSGLPYLVLILKLAGQRLLERVSDAPGRR